MVQYARHSSTVRLQCSQSVLYRYLYNTHDESWFRIVVIRGDHFIDCLLFIMFPSLPIHSTAIGILITSVMMVRSGASSLCQTQEKWPQEVFSRGNCLRIGQPHMDENGATERRGGFGGSDGKWIQEPNPDPGDTGHGWRWELPAPCALVPFSADFFCETMHSLHAKHSKQDQDHGLSGNSTIPKLVFVGDSITIQQKQAMEFSTSQLRKIRTMNIQHWLGYLS